MDKKKILGLIGLIFLSTKVYSQEYFYRGIKGIDLYYTYNKYENKEDDNKINKKEIISSDCYDPNNVGKIIDAEGCKGLYIVDNNILRDLVENKKFKGNKKNKGNKENEYPVNSYADDIVFTGQVTDMSYLFKDHTKILSISNWNTENVLNMRAMFFKAFDFNQPLNNWNVSSVENMRSMFFRATNFNQPLNNWDVSNVKNMKHIFFKADSFKQSIDSWNLESLEKY